MSIIHLPLLVTILYLAFEFQRLPTPIVKKMNFKRQPAAINQESENSPLALAQNFNSEDIRHQLLTTLPKVSDKLNQLKSRAFFLDKKMKDIESEKNDCLNSDENDCSNLTTLEESISSEIHSMTTEMEMLLFDKIDQINSSTVIDFSYQEGSCSLDSFTPDPYDPVKVIHMNFHFPVRDDKFSPGMFVEDHNGLGNTDYTVFTHIEKLIQSTNNHLERNFSSNQVAYQDILALPTKFMVRKNSHDLPRIPAKSTGSFLNYYHYSYYDYGILDSLPKIKDGTVFNLTNDGINLVFQEQFGSSKWHPPVYATDENGSRIPTNEGDGNVLYEFIRFNITNGNAIDKLLPINEPPVVVMANEWMGHVMYQKIWNDKIHERTNDIEAKNFTSWDRSKLIVEALGFVGGLDYIWINSNKVSDIEFRSCGDHPVQQSSPWCGARASNNIMDSNCYKNSWSPCQLTIAHYNYYHYLKHLLYLPDKADHQYDHYIPENLGDVYWDAPHDLIGSVYIGEGTTLHIGCQVTKPYDAQFFPETRVSGLQNVSVR